MKNSYVTSIMLALCCYLVPACGDKQVEQPSPADKKTDAPQKPAQPSPAGEKADMPQPESIDITKHIQDAENKKCREKFGEKIKQYLKRSLFPNSNTYKFIDESKHLNVKEPGDDGKLVIIFQHFGVDSQPKELSFTQQEFTKFLTTLEKKAIAEPKTQFAMILPMGFMKKNVSTLFGLGFVIYTRSSVVGCYVVPRIIFG